MKTTKRVGLPLPDLRLTYYKVIVVKTAWYWYLHRPISHWKRIESSEIDPHISSQYIFDKGNSVEKE